MRNLSPYTGEEVPVPVDETRVTVAGGPTDVASLLVKLATGIGTPSDLEALRELTAR